MQESYFWKETLYQENMYSFWQIINDTQLTLQLKRVTHMIPLKGGGDLLKWTKIFLLIPIIDRIDIEGFLSHCFYEEQNSKEELDKSIFSFWKTCFLITRSRKIVLVSALKISR